MDQTAPPSPDGRYCIPRLSFDSRNHKYTTSPNIDMKKIGSRQCQLKVQATVDGA
jgi:hypothetical protein